jgi:Cu(I)/Ag(I) efflux system membrane fusion protein
MIPPLFPHPARIAMPPLLVGLLALAALLGFTGCHPHQTAGGPADTPRFWCPMHPSYTSPRLGDCPICNMKLVPIPADGATNTGAPVAGRTTIMIPADRQQLIGLRTSTVFPRLLSRTLRTTGTVEHDETALARIAPRFGGWVRKLHINFTGQEVQQGQPLLTVYSPELHATESEYLLAWRQWTAATDSPAVGNREGARQMLESARRRLALWEVGEAEIRALEERGAPSDELLVRSPISGHVITKSAVEGRAFMAGETLYEIGVLDRLWLRTSVPESDLALIQTGQVVRATFAVLGGKPLETTVDFVYPHLDPQTRRGAVRMRVENPDHRLRPDMWAGVEIEENLGERLSVPASAVIDTGTRLLAFVQLEDGHLEPREVTVGVRTDDWWEVLGGLKEREKVVTRALFLVDSESQLKAVVAGMQNGGVHEK